MASSSVGLAGNVTNDYQGAATWQTGGDGGDVGIELGSWLGLLFLSTIHIQIHTHLNGEGMDRK
jgi:hypothetical protein